MTNYEQVETRIKNRIKRIHSIQITGFVVSAIGLTIGIFSFVISLLQLPNDVENAHTLFIFLWVGGFMIIFSVGFLIASLILIRIRKNLEEKLNKDYKK